MPSADKNGQRARWRIVRNWWKRRWTCIRKGWRCWIASERVVFWNRAAEVMTGYSGAEVVGRRLPEALEPLALGSDCEPHREPRDGPQPGRGSLVHAQHKMGRDVPGDGARLVLRDGLGGRIGTAAVFHPGEAQTALPHGRSSEVEEVRQSQAELEDRLANEFEMFAPRGRAAGGVVGEGRPGARVAQDPRGAGVRNHAGRRGAHPRQRAAAGRRGGALGRR